MVDALQKTIDGAVDHLRQSFSTLQAGRANTAMVEDLEVESYGAMMQLKATANISCPDARTVRIEPWDKSLIGAIEKAIVVADIGVTPQNMGDTILLPIPPMTEERRKKLVKIVHEEAEHAKIAVRNARQDTMKKIKADADLSDDEKKDLEADAQERVDAINKTIDEMGKKKEADILTI